MAGDGVMAFKFRRRFSDNNLRRLKEEPLFRERLRDDIVNTGDVFPAVRKDRVDFYHQGGKLFSYNGRKFSTHKKYASVLACRNDYVAEEYLKGIPQITSFSEHYDRIKENCALYSRDEAESVSHLYRRFSCVRDTRKGEIVILDIEVSFENKDDDQPNTDRKRSRQDRIDILLYHTARKELRFFEAKLFSNDEIRAEEEATPPVVDQMTRYRSQLSEEHREHILTQYGNHVDILNNLFNTSLPRPIYIDPEPRLYVFGFDTDQRDGRWKKNQNALRKHGVKVYAIGGPERADAKTLWSKAE